MIGADLILLNGNVATLDPSLPRVQALACRGEKIIYAGDNAGATELRAHGTRTIDLQGRTVLPGFNDPHVHVSWYGFVLQQVDLYHPKALSVADIVRLVAERVAQTPPGAWVQAQGYDQSKLAERRHPTRQELDEVSPNNPVVVGHLSGHMCVANSLALKLAGITADSVPPAGGRIEKHPATGELTGLIADQATPILEEVVPKPTVEEQADAIALALSRFVTAGITSCTDCGPTRTVEVSHLAGYYLARERGHLPVRCSVTIGDPLWEDAERLGLRPGLGDTRLSVGAMKIYADGALSARTAAVLQPYAGSEPDNYGEDDKPPEELAAAVSRAHAAGWQTAIHADGDRAIHNALNAIEAAMQAHPRKDHRHRVEHSSVMNPELTSRFARLGAVPVVQPETLYYLGDAYVRSLGLSRAESVMPMRSLLDQGVQLVGSSDCFVTPFPPFGGIKAAMLRKTLSGHVLAPEQSITLDEALAMYTWRGAYVTFEEAVKGTLSVGKLADIVVLSENPWDVAPEELDKIPTDATITGGEVVYERPLAGNM